MPPIPESASYSTWLFGQSAVVVVLILWIGSLHWALRRERIRTTALQHRNDELSDSLVDVLRESSTERAGKREKLVTNAIESIERALKG